MEDADNFDVEDRSKHKAYLICGILDVEMRKLNSESGYRGKK